MYDTCNKKFMKIDGVSMGKRGRRREKRAVEIYGKYARTFSKEYIWNLFRELSSNDHCHGGQNCICDSGEPPLHVTLSDIDQC